MYEIVTKIGTKNNNNNNQDNVFGADIMTRESLPEFTWFTR